MAFSLLGEDRENKVILRKKEKGGEAVKGKKKTMEVYPIRLSFVPSQR